MQAHAQKQMVLIVTITMIALLLCLIGLDVLPLTKGNDPLVSEQQAMLQAARVELLAKDALILQYRPITYHSQMISDLQTQLPMMEEVQHGFEKGDTALGIPSQHSDTETLLLTNARVEFDPLDAALRALLKGGNGPVDHTQVDIIEQHEYVYALAMARLAVALQQDGETTILHQVLIKVSIKFTIIVVLACFYIFSGRKILHRLAELEEEKERRQNAPIQA